MRLSQVKNKLKTLERLQFVLPDGTKVPSHFHITEVGVIQKNFIDCGGTMRDEKVVNFQLWSSVDVDHRLQPQKLLDIVSLSEKLLDMGDFEVEVEYQGPQTISKFGLDFSDNQFFLINKQTDCLAPDKCGLPAEKPKIRLKNIRMKANACDPNSGCC
ncbi:DUF6428 family protein [Roseivirga misakiensis]|uniref:Uncharacterized protein n=1 Tax=Roseivirga misakiensis TaxID=1563681 RepID=A0A1E5T005_9BACT|nr:DUF6428 family protein [Roseivirga misakiensis]OEK04712.1 hypothetical protein BFP71_14785 [Roseivirga misakiensis]